MSRISKSKLLSATSAITIAAFAASTANAQDADDQASADEVVEEIVVTGIRGSLRSSIMDKRSAEQIVDTINAEDIGKSTDKNIAEALNRVTGVSITDQGGEGAFVSVRGASPDQTIVTLNGTTLGTTEFSQSVNLSQYSSDILSKIEVIKTPSARDEEGSLGGLINLVTRKPLEIQQDILTFNAEGRWNSQYNSDKKPNSPFEDYRISGTISRKFNDDRFGVILTAVDEKNPLRQDFTRVNEFESVRAFNATDTAGNVYTSDDYSTPSLWGISARQTFYGVREGQRDRQAADLALQFEPFDTTSITFNVNYARQQVENTMHEVSVRNNDQSRTPNFHNVGSPYPFTTNNFLNGQPTPYEDPADWFILDPNSRTWVRSLRRFQLGDVNTSSDKYENENTVFSLDLEQSLFDDRLVINVGGSHQKSEQIPDQRVYLNMQSARENSDFLRFYIAPEDLQPVGVDCRTGVCVPVTGTSFISLGSIVSQPTAEDIAYYDANGILGTIGQPITGRNDDNVTFTGQNPDDILAKSIGFLNQTLTAVDDTNDVFFLDGDFELDMVGITTLEFGAKYTKREKFVDNQSGNVTNRNPAASIINPLTGQPVLVSNALDQTPLLPFAVTVTPNGFLEGVGLGGNNISDGFVSVDSVGVFNLVRADEGIAIDIDDTETRSAKFENLAVYLQANFGFMDDRLTGNVGVRYVKTEVETKGSAGIRAFNESFGRNQRIYDLRNLRSLMDPNQPACPAIPFDPDGEVPFGDAARYARVDGLGVDTQGTLTFNDDIPLPNSLPCHEPFLLDVANLQNLGFFPQDLRRYNNIFWTNNDIFTNGFATSDPEGLNLLPGTNNTIRTFGTSGAYEYEEFLPSLNLSYVINDEMIMRFAASKTMTRPPIDTLRPGFNIGEVGWGNPATRVNNINLFNTALDPLTSTNFDISFEWYFDEDALFAIGVFYKDIKDLIEEEEQQVYLRDVKTEVQNGEDVSFDGLLLDSSSITIDNCYAEILGEWQYGYNPSYVENMLFSDDPEFLCAQFRATQPRNAAGADITGVELQYTQNFTFLPGFWSGLGISANYTYQDSSFAQDTSDLVEGLELPRFQIDRTPEHSYNILAYWQHEAGHQVRLAYSGTTDMLLQRNFQKGSLWQEGRDTLDFSAAYQLNDSVMFTVDATNLLDETYRQYFTSRTIKLPESPTGGGTDLVDYDEGNAISGNAYKGRTFNEYSIGRFYRLGVRVNFN